jgi:hypothetical protein
MAIYIDVIDWWNGGEKEKSKSWKGPDYHTCIQTEVGEGVTRLMG